MRKLRELRTVEDIAYSKDREPAGLELNIDFERGPQSKKEWDELKKEYVKALERAQKFAGF